MDKERNKLILVLLTSRTLTDNKITPELELTSLLPKKKNTTPPGARRLGDSPLTCAQTSRRTLNRWSRGETKWCERGRGRRVAINKGDEQALLCSATWHWQYCTMPSFNNPLMTHYNYYAMSTYDILTILSTLSVTSSSMIYNTQNLK
jgi:hypothetical protein